MPPAREREAGFRQADRTWAFRRGWRRARYSSAAHTTAMTALTRVTGSYTVRVSIMATSQVKPLTSAPSRMFFATYSTQ